MKSNYEKLGKYISQVDIRNKDLKVTRLLGVSISKSFIESIANTIGTDFSNYKVVHKGQFAYGPVTSRNGEKISIALLEEDECIISSSYIVFKIVDVKMLLPEYLMLWFRRPEFDRYARYKSHGSVREIFDWDEMCNVELPVPDIDEQKKVVEAYRSVEERIKLKRKINDNLEIQAEMIYNEMIKNNFKNCKNSSLESTCVIKTGKLNSEAAVSDGKYPFFTCSQETFRTNTFSFDQEAVLLAGNNASAIYPLKLFWGKFDAYQRTYVITSKSKLVSNKQIYFILKQKLNEFKGVSSGTATKFLTMKILNPIPVFIMPEKVAEIFIEIMDKIFIVIYQNKNEIEYLTELQGDLLATIAKY